MKILIFIICVILFTGCAVNREKIKIELNDRVDPISVQDIEKYEIDLKDCAEFVAIELEKFQRRVLVNSIAGAMAGAGVGYAIGNTFNKNVANSSLVYGSVAGAGVGISNTSNKMYIIGFNCLINRGYKLLW
jgi:hypothetical protein